MGCSDSYQIQTEGNLQFECWCGKVCYTMRESVPRLQLYCCCRDCAENAECSAYLGNTQMKMETVQGPATTVVVANSIKEVRGIENIRIYKRRADCADQLHIATCCKAMIGVNHPGPGPHCVPMQGEACRVKCDGAKIGKESCTHRTFTDDWLPKNDPTSLPLPPFQGKDCPQMKNIVTSGFVFTFKSRTGKPAVKLPGDKTLQDIEAEIAAKHGPPIILGSHQKWHLLPGQGIRVDGMIGGADNMTVEYFEDFYARADSLRFMLHKAGVKHTYKGYSQAEWGALKTATPPQSGEFNGLPRLTLGGKEYGQSMAILRAFGSKYGFYNPTDPISSYYCDVIVDGCVDVLGSTSGALFPVLGKGGKADEEDFQKIRDLFKKSHVPTLNLLVANMKKHGGKYAAGNKVSIADCCMVSSMANIWCNEASPFYATFQECFAAGDVDKAAIDQYFATLKTEFADRLNSPERTPKVG